VAPELSAVPVEMVVDTSVIIGQAHFIKTVEDLHEAMVGAGGHMHFGIAFCEASGPCLIRRSGNDHGLVALATRSAEAIGSGHVFVVYLRGGHPINVLNAIKRVPEVCTVFCATANPVEVIVVQTELGRAVVGAVDGMPPAGVESEADEEERKALLRSLGYKL
jgi:uncharacterized protein